MKSSEIMTRWLAALRSGEYQQGEGYLCSGGKHCCLGVLAAVNGDIADRANHHAHHGVRYRDPGAPEDASWADLLETRELPEWALMKYGLTEREQEQLMTLNDRHVAFWKIADLIEESINRGLPIEDVVWAFDPYLSLKEDDPISG